MGPEILLLAGIIVLLLLISAFFSASETALTGASRARMFALEKSGNRRAAAVNRLYAGRERFIGAILVGNNFVNILASTLGTALFLEIFDHNAEKAIAIATAVMTLLIIVFGEVLPKTYAFNYADRTALVVAPIISATVRLLYPIIRAIQAFVWVILRMMGVNARPETDSDAAHDEIRGAIDMHHSGGAVESEDRFMLGGVLDLKSLSVGEVMVHRKNISMLDADLPSQQLLDLVLASKHTRLPLYRDDSENIIGVLHVKDLLRAVARHRGGIASIDIPSLATKPWFVPETTTLQEQLSEFLKRGVHFAIVVDEYGALCGLVTLEDILEEIVGQIRDEHDRETSGVRPQADGTIILDGWVAIRDVNRALHWSLPDDNATTVAGLVIHESQTIPEVGQVFVFHGFKFEIMRKHRNQITALRMTPPLSADPQGSGSGLMT